MNKSQFKAGSLSILASSLLIGAYGQNPQQSTSGTEFKGKIAKTFAESEEYWPEKRKAPA
mgnify:CR=1 FL=1